jgi:hypothetical protein
MLRNASMKRGLLRQATPLGLLAGIAGVKTMRDVSPTRSLPPLIAEHARREAAIAEARAAGYLPQSAPGDG